MDAVIFDLFGTLVGNLDPTRLHRAMDAMAVALGAPVDDFSREWRQHFVARMDGTIPDGDAQFQPILNALGLTSPDTALSEASEIRRTFMVEALAPRPGVVECLETLRSRGVRLALSSDCSSETPQLLNRTPLGAFFEVRACSAELGVRKPHPRMYQHVLEHLRLEGHRCLYVGDGNSEELPGAKAHGMTTVWVDNGTEQHWEERFVPGGDHTVTDLREVPSILDKLR